jgi:methanogenic corrinoid protein MtbC1
MGIEVIAAAALEGLVEVAGLIKRAIDASRAGDDAAALSLLDEALKKNGAAVTALTPALEAVRERVLAKIEAGEV